MGMEYSTPLGLDVLPISTDPNNLPDLHRLYNAAKSLAISLDVATGAISRPVADWSGMGAAAIRLQNLARFYCMFSDSVTPGMIVNIYNNSGTPTARKAGGAALGGGLTRGFVIASVTAGSYGEVFLAGVNTFITGLTAGLTYYTSTGTAGLVTATPPSSPYIQEVGYALNAGALWVNPTNFAR